MTTIGYATFPCYHFVSPAFLLVQSFLRWGSRSLRPEFAVLLAWLSLTLGLPLTDLLLISRILM